MIDVDSVYFEWLLTQIDSEGVQEGVAHLCGLLHNCDFTRRVGRDFNRAQDGTELRQEFLRQFSDIRIDPHTSNAMMDVECSWLEMLIGLARRLDYLYDGGVESRFLEMIENMKLGPLMEWNPRRTRDAHIRDQERVDEVTDMINDSQFDEHGHGGLFPLQTPNHSDQRRAEIWEQHSAYFNERFEGVLWTSTN